MRLVTAPISKDNTQADDFRYPGHTEFLTSYFEAPESLMFLVDEDAGLRIATVTGHIPLKDVPARLTAELLRTKITAAAQVAQRTISAFSSPASPCSASTPTPAKTACWARRKAIIVSPVIQQFAHDGHLVVGPFPADGYFGTQPVPAVRCHPRISTTTRA